ncbi:MAG: hypothetical protein M3507_01430 [Actinomycetota bacterium]|nr:hypothetical protein [Actinomycetota bacterium]
MAHATPDACCPECSSPLALISFVRGPSTMTMGSCAWCHTRWWWEDGAAVKFPRVLADLSSSRSPAVRGPNPSHR